MRILLITQWFDPEPVPKGLSFAKALEQRGHCVQVLTGFPNYPTGKIYPGYKVKFFQKEVMDGLDVFRVPLYPSHDSSAFGRITNYVSFALSAAMMGPWLAKKPDLVYVYHPPPTTYIPAFIFKLLYRVPVVFDIQDFWPDTLAATGMFNSKLGLMVIDGYCRLFYKIATKIVVLSPGFKPKLVEKRVPQEKVQVIYNWFDEKNLSSSADVRVPDVLKEPGTLKILFAGNMGKAQALGTVLTAARQLAGSNPDIRFVMIGGGVDVEELKARALQMDLTNVVFLPPVPPSQVGAYLDAADILLVHLKNDPLFRITIPSKIQAYLAAGKPILCAVPGDASHLVMEAQAGLTCPSEAPESLAEAAVKFSEMTPAQCAAMGQRGRDFYQKNICMKAGVDRFNELFHQLTRPKER